MLAAYKRETTCTAPTPVSGLSREVTALIACLAPRSSQSTSPASSLFQSFIAVSIENPGLLIIVRPIGLITVHAHAFRDGGRKG